MFNAQQLEIIKLRNPRIAVLAGAGTGKSSTVVGRIVSEVKDGMPEHNIAVITFTNDACKSITEKLEKNNIDPDDMIVKTLHGFCYGIYTTYCEYNDVRRAKIVSSPYRAFLGQFWALVGSWKGLPSKSLKQYLSFVNNCQLERLSPDQALDELCKQYSKQKISINDMLKEAIKEKPMLEAFEYMVLIYHSYETFKKTTNQLDFNDMLNYAIDNLDCPRTLNFYRRKIKSLYIDEYQDTNQLIVLLLEKLVSPEMNVVLVGDTRQAIYSFIGAEPKVTLGYMEKNNFQQLSLNTNYRSSQKIVANSNKFISHYPAVNLGGDLIDTKPDMVSDVSSFVSDNEMAEKANLIDMLNDLRARGYEYKDIAILYRTNAQAMMMIDYCVTKEVPFVIKKDSASIFSRNEMRDIFAYLKIFNTLDLVTIEDIKRIGNKPSRFVPNKAYANIKDKNFGTNLVYGKYDRDKSLEKLASELSRHYRNAKNMSLADQINYIAHDVGYIKHWEKVNMNDALFDISLYFNCLGSLVQDYDTYPKLVKQVNKIKRALKDRNETEGLNFYSIHGSKGLEFPVVIVLGVCDRVYPFYRSVSERGQEGEEEEARLFYVASTRPIEHLYYSEIVGTFGRFKVKKSPFIDKTNRELLNPYPEDNEEKLHGEEDEDENDY